MINDNITGPKGMNSLIFLIHIANHIPWERGEGFSLSPSQEEGTVIGLGQF